MYRSSLWHLGNNDGTSDVACALVAHSFCLCDIYNHFPYIFSYVQTGKFTGSTIFCVTEHSSTARMLMCWGNSVVKFLAHSSHQVGALVVDRYQVLRVPGTSWSWSSASSFYIRVCDRKSTSWVIHRRNSCRNSVVFSALPDFIMIELVAVVLALSF